MNKLLVMANKYPRASNARSSSAATKDPPTMTTIDMMTGRVDFWFRNHHCAMSVIIIDTRLNAANMAMLSVPAAFNPQKILRSRSSRVHVCAGGWRTPCDTGQYVTDLVALEDEADIVVSRKTELLEFLTQKI